MSNNIQISDANIAFNELPTYPGSKDAWLKCVDDPSFDVNAGAKDGLRPIHIAASCEPSGELVARLIQLGANVDDPNAIDSTTPLALAIRMHHITNIHTLLEYGANYHRCKVRDGREFSVLDIAEQWCGAEMVELASNIMSGQKTKSANKK